MRRTRSNPHAEPATLDRAQNAVTYRVFGREEERRDAYEGNLTAYEKAAVRAQIWNASMPPLYRVISMAGVGSSCIRTEECAGKGLAAVGASRRLQHSCPVLPKLSMKSSSAAKLFNAVHKAQVRGGIAFKPCLAQKPQDDGQKPDEGKCAANRLEVEHLKPCLSGREKGAEQYCLQQRADNRHHRTCGMRQIDTRQGVPVRIPMKGRSNQRAGFAEDEAE
ncbi:MAG: hypothetical protein V8Q79_07830 [Christensenellales bacterium]